MTASHELRCVVFLTRRCAPDMPVRTPGMPAALLPLGACTFAEKVMESCAQAGIRSIDLVTSDSPELLRRVLADGWRWNVELRWHAVKDPVAPYGIFRSLGLHNAPRVIVGHGDHWIAPGVLKALADSGPAALFHSPQSTWTGWISLTGAQATALEPPCTYAACEKVALALHGRHAGRQLQAPEHASAGSAAMLLAAQRGRAGDAPPTWRRESWGAASPLAHIHPQSQIEGPVLIGPGAIIEKSARVGPHAVVCARSVVSQGTTVRDAVILPDTWVGGNLLLEQGVAEGARWYNIALATTLTGSDIGGLLADLGEAVPRRASLASRLAALVLGAALLPAWALARLGLAGRAPNAGGWTLQAAVQGRCARTGRLRMQAVRMSPGAGLAGRIIGLQGSLLDLVQGRRSWLGVRARDEAAWQALPPDWQVLFANQPIGVLHAAAWSEPSPGVARDASAAADAYLTVRLSRLGILRRWHGWSLT